MKTNTIEKVRDYFAEYSYILVTKQYRNAHAKLKFICPSGHRGETSWNNFQQGTRCSICSGNRKKEFDFVKQCFEKENYRLLSTKYINAKAKLHYKCPQGHIGSITWNKFSSGHRCAQCAGVTNPVVKIEKIRRYFEREEYRLLSTKYKNPSTKLLFICPQGHQGKIRWVDFKRGSRCAKCMGRAIPSIEEIRQHFEQRSCQLLSTQYVNAHEKLDYICPKGHRNFITWTSFYHAGCTCSKCHEPKKQKELGRLLEQMFSNRIKQQDRFDFLGLLSVDYSIRDLNLLFEYDGEHHFMPTRYGNMSSKIAQERFVAQQQRDQRKNRLCVENGYTLIRIAYCEELTLENVQKKINKALEINQCLK